MTISALSTSAVSTAGIEVTPQADGSVVLRGEHISFANLPSAISALIGELRGGESTKIKVARIVQCIRDQALYKEAGVDNFKAFLPQLLDKTAAVGWKSHTSLRRYLSFVDLYLDTLQFDEQTAIRGVSHLFELYVLAKVDRKTGQLSETEGKPGKLNPVQFEDIARLVSFLVEAKPANLRAKLAEGMSAEDLATVLKENGLALAAKSYAEIMKAPVVLPAKGWTLAQTEAIVAAVQGTTDEEDEDNAKVERVWRGYETFEGGVFVEAIDFVKSGDVVETIEVGKGYSQAQFKTLAGKDATKIAGNDGEQADEDEEDEE